jgi:asparaginyl-tRNA synthetase
MDAQSRIREILDRPAGDARVSARGWIRTRRDSKDLCFVEVNDGSCLANLQVVASRGELAAYDEVVPRLTTGASLEVEGRLVPSLGKGQAVELRATAIRVVGDAPAAEYPLQKKRHSFEYLREIAHLRPRTNTFGAVARVRNTLSFAVHEFFQQRGFLYVHTPLLTASDAEGAGAMFQVTTLPLDDVPTVEGAVDYSQDFFKTRTALTVSGQLEAEIYATALGSVYTFGPTFRAEHSSTSRHLAEFWMIEPEIAFCDIHGNMTLAEEFLKSVFAAVLERCAEDMKFFAERIDPAAIDTLQRIVDSEFARMTYTEAIGQLEKSGRSFEYPVSWGIDLQSEHERYLTEDLLKKPVILTDYPKQIKAFYMKANDDGRTVRAMDVLVPRIGEIIGGSQREDDHDRLASRIDELGFDRKEYWWYLELRKYGSVPHSGFGLGFERLVQFVTGMKNIRDVIPFPRAWGEIGF